MIKSSMVSSTDASVAGPVLLFFGHCDHGVDGMVGRREANWARDNSTITDSL